MVGAEPPPPGRMRRRRPEDTAESPSVGGAGSGGTETSKSGISVTSSLERSAATWTNRATLLDRLEDQATARVKAEARPRITGLGDAPERKDGDAD